MGRSHDQHAVGAGHHNGDGDGAGQAGHGGQGPRQDAGQGREPVGAGQEDANDLPF